LPASGRLPRPCRRRSYRSEALCSGRPTTNPCPGCRRQTGPQADFCPWCSQCPSELPGGLGASHPLAMERAGMGIGFWLARMDGQYPLESCSWSWYRTAGPCFDGAGFMVFGQRHGGITTGTRDDQRSGANSAEDSGECFGHGWGKVRRFHLPARIIWVWTRGGDLRRPHLQTTWILRRPKLIVGDFAHTDVVRRTFKGVDTIVHLGREGLER
jgi:hypothetical protein